MSHKTKKIVAELEYTNIHSDLDFDFEMKEEIRKPLHDCLDEWLDKSNGEGGFYLRNANHHFEDYFELLEKPKRKPLPDGTLPMTDEEKYELCKMMGYENISEIFYDNKLHFKCFDKGWGIIVDVKAILYLANLFDLEV